MNKQIIIAIWNCDVVPQLTWNEMPQEDVLTSKNIESGGFWPTIVGLLLNKGERITE